MSDFSLVRATGRLQATFVAGIFASATLIAVACAEISTDPQVVASIAIDSLVSPSIVANDSLRDTLGIARPMHATIYNIQGTPLASIPIRFRTPDSGLTVDSVLGYVVADTARASGIRLFAAAGSLQAAPDTVYIVPKPDTVVAVNARDSLLYSLTDTASVVSNPLQLQLQHLNVGGGTLPVRSYIVSYAITYPSDTVLAKLVTRDGSRRSSIDTTDATGTSARRIRLRTLSLTSASDSVVVVAMVRYLGMPVPGAPIRFVLLVKPQQ
ncbi:MAG: hypothetical protein ABI311_08675 [Gemmatimonadaceae bacterium]